MHDNIVSQIVAVVKRIDMRIHKKLQRTGEHNPAVVIPKIHLGKQRNLTGVEFRLGRPRILVTPVTVKARR